MMLVVGSVTAVVAVIVALVAITVATRPKKTTSFALPANPTAAIKAAGLPLLGAEGEVLHVHAHLDMYLNGKKVTVPANVGIASATAISPLHTHYADDIIHVESPVQKDFTLGQFFKEWQVPLSAQCVGTHCGGVSTYVNGKAVSGDPAAVVLGAHQEIALVVGSKPATIPSRYSFPQGY